MYCVFRKNGSGEYIPLATVSTTTYVDTMAQSGVTYTYSVRCVAAGDGESYASGYATGKNITYLAQPSNLKASSAGYNSVKVTWSKVSGATAYVVYRKNGSSWKSLKKVTTNSYTDTGLTTGTSYTYTVRAYKSSIYSTINTTGVSASPVPAAVKLTSISRNGSSITIKWNKVDGASGYYIYRKVPGGSWSSIKTVGSSVTSYTNTGLKPGSYTYTVRAYRTVSKKNISGALNSTGKSINYNPDAPKLSSVTVAKGSVTVKWAKVANATGYLVYRKTAGAGWQLISTITKNTTVSYKDTKAVKGKTYYYTVRAYTTTGNTKVYSAYNTTGLKAVAK
jgi:fibronectin type 3 domain-containing protein